MGTVNVKCSEVQNCLSAYCDGELTAAEQSAVASHLASCSDCREELASFQELSRMSAALTDPQPPSDLWNRLAAKLDREVQPKPGSIVSPRIASRRLTSAYWAAAASVLVAVVLGVAGYRSWYAVDSREHLAINLEHYWREFERDPATAQQTLLTQYNGRQTTLQQATAALRYQPVVAKGFPPGCELKDVYMLDMPCCTSAQAICRCDDGQHIAVFEHDLDHPVTFGDRPSVECVCDGKPTSIVQIDERLAATWQAGDRYITIVGARDLEDVTRFVTHLR